MSEYRLWFEGGRPSSSVAVSWLFAFERQAAASKASSGFSEKALTPRLKPPSGGFDGVPATTSGNFTAPMVLAMSGAFSVALPSAKV